MPKMIAEPYHQHLVLSFLGTAIQNETDVKEAAEFLNHYLLNSGEKIMVIDLTRVRTMTSAMIGELVEFIKKCDAEKRKLKLCGLSPQTDEVFRITNMDKIFKYYPDRAKALGRAAKIQSGGVKQRQSLRD